MTIAFVDPRTNVRLVRTASGLVHPDTGVCVAPIVDGIPRFVRREENYAGAFGFQWQHWSDILSDRRTTGDTKEKLLLRRTHFSEYDLSGATLLECGMGGGDDTEVLLKLGVGELHAFDLSDGVDRAARCLDDPRVVISQASIFDIPYPDSSFDVVFCHRVLQHTPDPVRALRAVAGKVRRGGVLFAHCYKRSWRYMMNYKYKYRWLTKRLSHRAVYAYLQAFGPALHRLNHWMYSRNVLLKAIAYNFVAFEGLFKYGELNEAQVLELAKLVTFDALTPRYDRPMSARKFRSVIESEGFRIDYFHNPKFSPLYCTAVKI